MSKKLAPSDKFQVRGMAIEKFACNPIDEKIYLCVETHVIAHLKGLFKQSKLKKDIMCLKCISVVEFDINGKIYTLSAMVSGQIFNRYCTYQEPSHGNGEEKSTTWI